MVMCKKHIYSIVEFVTQMVFFQFQISELAQRYPGLMSLRSVDLSPASWMAVAW